MRYLILIGAMVLGGCSGATATYPTSSLQAPEWAAYPHPLDSSVAGFEIESRTYDIDKTQAQAADECKANGWHLPALSEWIAVEQSALPQGFERSDLEWIGRPSNAILPTGDVEEDLDASAALSWRCSRPL